MCIRDRFEEVWGSSIYEDGTSIPGLMSNLIMKLRLINNDQEYIKPVSYTHLNVFSRNNSFY